MHGNDLQHGTMIRLLASLVRCHRWRVGFVVPSSLAAALALMMTTSLRAQAPAPELPDRARAEARAAALSDAQTRLQRADTAGAVAVLRDATAQSPQDAVLWHEYGMLLSAWTRAHWRKGIMPGGVPQRFIAAESSLARAMHLAPDSARYAVHYGNHLWGSNFTSLTMAKRAQEGALERAERNGDSLSVSESSDAIGLLLWRRYEPMANRRYEIQQLGYTFTDFVLEPYKFRVYIDDATRLYAPPLGDYLHREALQYFRRARELHPDNELALRHEAMALAERDRWEELAGVARRQSVLRPAQRWPWLALGLAEHRLGHSDRASVAFDSGFARLPKPEREHLMSLSRLLPTLQQTFFDTLSAPAKEQLSGMYWNVASPTLLLDDNPVLDEFRARVVYADLLWTNEEVRQRGADTDRGEILIRWGPPDVISTHSPELLSWMYRRVGLNFFFNHPPTIGTASLTQFYRSNMLEPNKLKRPAIWENVPVMRRGVDSLAVQVARFRGATDSIDVAVFAGIRAGALRSASPADTTVLRTGVFAVDASGNVQTRVTDRVRTGEKDTLVLAARTWRTRIPATAAFLRVEALETDAIRVARAIRDVTGFSRAGFGSSDLLIATTLTAPTTAAADTRWSDFTIVPVTGNAIRVGRPLELLWEVYEPRVVDGSASYRVSIAVQRVEPTGLKGVAARISNGVRGAVTRAGGTDRVAVEYDRTISAVPVFVEQLRLDLGGAKRGRYLLTLEVRDLHSGQSITRTRELVLVDR